MNSPFSNSPPLPGKACPNELKHLIPGLALSILVFTYPFSVIWALPWYALILLLSRRSLPWFWILIAWLIMLPSAFMSSFWFYLDGRITLGLWVSARVAGTATLSLLCSGALKPEPLVRSLITSARLPGAPALGVLSSFRMLAQTKHLFSQTKLAIEDSGGKPKLHYLLSSVFIQCMQYMEELSLSIQQAVHHQSPQGALPIGVKGWLWIAASSLPPWALLGYLSWEGLTLWP